MALTRLSRIPPRRCRSILSPLLRKKKKKHIEADAFDVAREHHGRRQWDSHRPQPNTSHIISFSPLSNDIFFFSLSFISFLRLFSRAICANNVQFFFNNRMQLDEKCFIRRTWRRKKKKNYSMYNSLKPVFIVKIHLYRVAHVEYYKQIRGAFLIT